VSDQDPAVSGWQAATEAHLAASTSAIGRDLQSQLDRLRKDYNAVLLERSELVNELHAMAKDLGAAILANDQLKRANEQLAADKGLAATEAPDA
jgi:N-formylglutamate amidohydrolase